MIWRSFNHKNPVLAAGEIHLWKIHKQEHLDRYEVYWELLSDQEKKKAMHFRFYKDKSCYVIAKGVLRTLLGAYLKCDPTSISIKYAHNGKPFVFNEMEIHFNVSHAKDCILIGFAKKHEIGVDVEYVDRPVEVELIARSFFSSEEVTQLLAIDQKYQNQAFYNCWTRKEAFIKALGEGLSFPLDQFVVSLDSIEDARLITTLWDLEEKSHWFLTSVVPCDNYVGAVALRGAIDSVTYWKVA